jgi:hypothetical protein
MPESLPRNETYDNNNDGYNSSTVIRPTHEVVGNSRKSSKSKTKVYRWRNEHFSTFPWIQYDQDSRQASCKFAECKMYVMTFMIKCPDVLTFDSVWTYPSLESRLFHYHEDTYTHQKQDLQQSQLPKGQKRLRMPSADLKDDDIWTRINSAWWLAKEDVAIHKFPSHLESSLVGKGLQPPKSYKDEHFAWDLVELIGKHFRKDLQRRIQRSPYFGIMADETTDNSVQQQLIIYVKCLNSVEGILQPTVSYLDLVRPESGSAKDIKV